MIDTVLFYCTQRGGWRWKRTDGDNGKITGASSEAFHNIEDCIANFEMQFRPYVLNVSYPKGYKGKVKDYHLVNQSRDGN